MKPQIIIFLTALTIALLMSGCGAIDRAMATLSGSAIETCHRGIVYLQFTSGASMAVDEQGKPLRCKEW